MSRCGVPKAIRSHAGGMAGLLMRGEEALSW